MGLFDAKAVDFKSLEVEEPLQTSSALGKGFASSGGVAQAVVKVINEMRPDMEVKTVKAEGLAECKKMLMMAKAGRYDGYLLEGMACPGGCVGGAAYFQMYERLQWTYKRYGPFRIKRSYRNTIQRLLRINNIGGLEMKLKTKQITVTAVMIALSIVVIQFIKAPLMIAGQSVAISGALINLILIIDTLYCGLVSGVILSVIIPVFSFILTQSPLISAVPVILPCIMIGNIVFVLLPGL